MIIVKNVKEEQKKMSNLRRRILLEKKSEETQKYIQDGLIFELDGTDKQATSQYVWVDKVGGKGFRNDGGVIEISNGFTFNGTRTSILSCDTTLHMQYPTTSTIELVIYPRMVNQWSPIFSPEHWYNDNQYAIVAYHAQNNKPYPAIKYSTMSTNYNNQSYKISNNKLFTCSLFNNRPIYENKQLITTYNMSDVGTASNKDYMYVGGRKDGSTITTFKGDIHAIRVYDRILTEEEIFYNQSIDIIKYNIEI